MVRWSFGARGRVPRFPSAVHPNLLRRPWPLASFAQRWLIVFFWPTRASSWNHNSMPVPRGSVASTAANRAGRLF